MVSASHFLIASASISSTAVSKGFNAADFFSPFLATTTVHKIAGSVQVSLILTQLLAPINEQQVVSSGKNMYSGGQPTAPA